MTDKQLRQAIINPTQVLVSDGVNVESNLGYFNLGATGRDLLATATQAEAQSVIGSTAGGSNENRLINGGLVIDQRNDGAAQTLTAGAALAYTVDRWYGYAVGANVTGQRVQGATAGQFRYQFTGAASVTAIGFGQRIEQLNSADLAGTTATLSVDLANSLLTSVTWTAYYANTADTFGTLASPTRTQIATGTFTVSSTVTRHSTQIEIPIEATTGIEVVFTVGAQTSGTWTIGAVKLEPGDTATPLVLQDPSTEIIKCLRYARWLRLANFDRVSVGLSFNSAGVFIIPAIVPMRATPTMTASAANTFRIVGGSSVHTLTSITLDATESNKTVISLTTSSVFSNGIACWLSDNNTTAFLGFSAEL